MFDSISSLKLISSLFDDVSRHLHSLSSVRNERKVIKLAVKSLKLAAKTVNDQCELISRAARNTVDKKCADYAHAKPATVRKKR